MCMHLADTAHLAGSMAAQCRASSTTAPLPRNVPGVCAPRCAVPTSTCAQLCPANVSASRSASCELPATLFGAGRACTFLSLYKKL